MLTEQVKRLTKEELSRAIHISLDSKLFEHLGKDPLIMRCPIAPDLPIWYHISNRESDDYYGNIEVHEDEHEVWIDSETIARDLNLRPRRYGFWFLLAKYE